MQKEYKTEDITIIWKPIVFDAAGMSYRSVGQEVGKAWAAGKKFTE